MKSAGYVFELSRKSALIATLVNENFGLKANPRNLNKATNGLEA